MDPSPMNRVSKEEGYFAVNNKPYPKEKADGNISLRNDLSAQGTAKPEHDKKPREDDKT